MADDYPDHWPMGPSSAARWLKCPGSVKALQGYTESGDMSAANRGSLGHSLVEQLLTDPRGPVKVPEEWRETYEALAEDEWAKLKEQVRICVDYVRSLPVDSNFHFEERIAYDVMPDIHGGTCDVIAYGSDGALHIVDFKFGWVKVPIEGNPQVMSYMNLARQMYPEAKKFIGTIVQPAYAPNHVKRAEFTLWQLQEHERDVIAASLSDEIHGGEHCDSTYCPLRAECHGFGRWAQEQLSEFPDLTEVVTLEPDELAKKLQVVANIYKLSRIIDEPAKVARKIILRLAKQGIDLEEVGLRVQNRSILKWKNDEAAARFAFLANIDEKQLFEEKAKSPAALVKELDLKREDFVNGYRELLTFQDQKVLKRANSGEPDEFLEFPDLDLAKTAR